MQKSLMSYSILLFFSLYNTVLVLPYINMDHHGCTRVRHTAPPSHHTPFLCTKVVKSGVYFLLPVHPIFDTSHNQVLHGHHPGQCRPRVQAVGRGPGPDLWVLDRPKGKRRKTVLFLQLIWVYHHTTRSLHPEHKKEANHIGLVFLLSRPGERMREEAEGTKTAEQSLGCSVLWAGDLF